LREWLLELQLWFDIFLLVAQPYFIVSIAWLRKLIGAIKTLLSRLIHGRIGKESRSLARKS
jgi:hypothetical protein